MLLQYYLNLSLFTFMINKVTENSSDTKDCDLILNQKINKASQ